MPARPALLLINPNSRQGVVDPDAIEARLREGMPIVRESPESPAELGRLIARHSDQIDRVIVGGGDGTMNAALPGVIDSGLPLAVIPLGTANDFARSIGVPLDPLAACDAAVTGQMQRIDVGEINGRYFVNVAHIGFAVEVARRSDGQTKQRLGAIAYPYAAWTAFRTRRTFVAYIGAEDGWHRLRSIQVSIGNGRFYGGGVPVAEDATIDDGRLDLYAIPAHKGSSLLAMMPALRQGRVHGHAQIFSRSGERFEIRTNKPKTVSVDGEEAFKTPVRIHIHRDRLSVLVPRDSA